MDSFVVKVQLPLLTSAPEESLALVYDETRDVVMSQVPVTDELLAVMTDEAGELVMKAYFNATLNDDGELELEGEALREEFGW